jgi:dipeptidase D
MIGLDSENEGEICTTSSGGCDVVITKKLNFIDNDNRTYTLLVKGLSGGHSGSEIHRGKANANSHTSYVWNDKS